MAFTRVVLVRISEILPHAVDPATETLDHEVHLVLHHGIPCVSQSLGTEIGPWAHLLKSRLGMSVCMLSMWESNASNFAYLTSLRCCKVDVTAQ